MDERRFAICLDALFADTESRDVAFEPDVVIEVQNFKEAGVATRNQGVVVRMADGDVFEVTVVRSRRGRGNDEDEA